jgi:hypothetical protein
MTCVNTAAFFESPNFWEIANAELDRLSKEYLNEVYTRFLNEVYFNQASQYDFGMLGELNSAGVAKQSNSKTRLDENYIDQYKQAFQKFYGSA